MKKDNDVLSRLTNDILTESMDIGTKEYADFRLLIGSNTIWKIIFSQRRNWLRLEAL